MRLRLTYTILAALLTVITASAGSSPKIKYPGGKYFIYRYILKDKQGSPYTLDHPGRWLSHKSVERRKKQGLALDSTDLPVSHRYIRSIEKIANGIAKGKEKKQAEWAIV